MDKLWKILTGTQPQPISEAGTSNQQSIQNNYNGPVTVHAQNASLGCNDGNNKGQAENSSRKRSLPVDVDDLDCTRLKTYYKHTLCETLPLPWYTEHAWNIHEVYTELALEGSENKFGVDELFEQCPGRFPIGVSYRILIEGDAGYGKSTLMLKIASDWSEEDSNDTPNYTSPFGLLLVVKLGYVGEDENLLSYMESIYNEKMDKRLEDVLKSKGAEKVLILLDGYDEANANTKKEVDRIMKKEKMMCCHVVLTSRFGHVPDAVKSKALRVTVKGFGRKQVMEAVGKFFIKAGHLTKADVISCVDDLSTLNIRSGWRHKSILLNSDDFQNVQEIFPLLHEEKRLGLDQFKKFIKKLQDESPYEELAQCPLLCAMMCCLVSECPNSELPSTCSGLYFAMINRNLYRAVRKKAEAAGKVDVKWNLSVLDSRIHEGHESFLQEFGRLCVVGLKTRSMSFTLFDITGNEQAAETTDVKVTELIEAGVLVQDFTEFNTKGKIPRYQVPHRTTAEFLAAYYLSGETDQNLLQQNLLDLFRLKTSFNEVAVSLIEMGKQRCLADAFSVIKFPSNCLKNIPFVESYFTQHEAAGTWSEFKDSLPNELQIKIMGHDITVSSSEPCLTLLELIEVFGKMNTGNTNVLRSLNGCPVSFRVIPPTKENSSSFFNSFGRTELCSLSNDVEEKTNLQIMLHALVKSGVVFHSLEFYPMESTSRSRYIEKQEYVVPNLQELLKSGSCPVQLSFKDPSQKLLLAVTEAMQEVPEACRLRSFEFFSNRRKSVDTSPLSEVLAEKWLSHLQHLNISSTYVSFVSPEKSLWYWRPGGFANPILKRLTEPGCSLTSLHLYGCFDNNNGGMVFEDLMMLATKLVTLRLEEMRLHFDVTRSSEYAVREKCSLKSLHLDHIQLKLKGLLPSADKNKGLLLGWRNVALSLEELTIEWCVFPVELYSWLNLSVPNLRTLSIGSVSKWRPNDNRDSFDTDSYAKQLLEALTRSSGESIEELSLLTGFWERCEEVILHPFREALQRCPRLKKVKLKNFSSRYTSGCRFGEEGYIDYDSCLALLKIVLSVPMLQTLTSKCFFEYWDKIGTFRAIADNAKIWPGKSFDKECNTLTLHGLSNENAYHAMHVFRERKLEYRLRYVTEDVYELWFPV